MCFLFFLICCLKEFKSKHCTKFSSQVSDDTPSQGFCPPSLFFVSFQISFRSTNLACWEEAANTGLNLWLLSGDARPPGHLTLRRKTKKLVKYGTFKLNYPSFSLWGISIFIRLKIKGRFSIFFYILQLQKKKENCKTAPAQAREPERCVWV